MDKKVVAAWEANKHKLRPFFESAHPRSYGAIVNSVVTLLHGAMDEWERPDPARITEIDHGEFQGTLVYVIGEAGYQPSKYWYVKVGYGSCSVCDTLESLRDFSDEKPTAEQVDGYMTLVLHIVQGLRQMGEDEA